MNIFLALNLISLVYTSTYTLVVSDITLSNPKTHTWVDSSNTAVPEIATLSCSLLPQPYISVSGTTAQAISNTYTLTASASTEYEAFIKVIFSGTWVAETFSIYSGTTSTVVKTQSLTSSTFTTPFCSLTNVNVMLFKVTIMLAAQAISLKLIQGYPAGSDVKTIYVGPVLIYRVDPDVLASTSYVTNEQFNYFKDTSQNPSAIMSQFALTSGSGLNFDVMTVRFIQTLLKDLFLLLTIKLSFHNIQIRK